MKFHDCDFSTENPPTAYISLSMAYKVPDSLFPVSFYPSPAPTTWPPASLQTCSCITASTPALPQSPSCPAFAPGAHSLETLSFASIGCWWYSAWSHSAHYGEFSSLKSSCPHARQGTGLRDKRTHRHCPGSEGVQSRYGDSK